MMYLPGNANNTQYPITTYTTPNTGNLFAFANTAITGNSSSVTLSNAVLANTGMQVSNGGVYQITFGLALTSNNTTTATITAPPFYANLCVNGTKLVGKYQTISCDTGSTLYYLQSLTTIMPLNAGDVVTVVNGTGSTFYINSQLNSSSVGGPAAYVTLFRLH
jgi:hypothetical protein